MMRLGDATEMLVGFAFKSAGFLDAEAEGIPLLRGENVQQGYIRWGDKTKKWSVADSVDLDRYRLAEGDVILAMDRPIVGDGLKMAWIQPSDLPSLLVQRVCRLRGVPGVSLTKYIRYVLAAPEFSAHIHSITTGANIPHISSRDISAYEFHLPSLDDQARISEVLSAYDDLIATNQRRISLLEDAARLLYREWFVHLRFPGHELVPVRDGVPQGWRRTTLGQICTEVPLASIQTGPFGSQLHQHDYTETGTPVVMPQDIVNDRIRMDRISFVSEDTATRLARHVLKPLDIVFPRRGDISKRALTHEKEAGFLCGTGCLKISLPPEPLHPVLLFYILADPKMVRWIEGQAVGATMLNLNTSILSAVEFLVPPREIQELFISSVAPMREQAAMLDESIRNTVQARDLLLPKLMSGQLDVSSIPLPDEVPA